MAFHAIETNLPISRHAVRHLIRSDSQAGRPNCGSGDATLPSMPLRSASQSRFSTKFAGKILSLCSLRSVYSTNTSATMRNFSLSKVVKQSAELQGIKRAGHGSQMSTDAARLMLVVDRGSHYTRVSGDISLIGTEATQFSGVCFVPSSSV